MRCAPVLLLALLAAATTLVAPHAQAQKRVALVIGNAAYQNTTRLVSPSNDASDLAAALARLGFDVVDGNDLDKRAMERTMRQFTQKLAHADVALFYFAGHAVQSGGQNYLLPTDARLRSEGDIDFEALPLALVLRQMEREAKTSIVLLDACRDNPLARSLARSMGTRSSAIGQGLAEVRAGVGSLVGFATQPGNIALDGEGRNSPYAKALLKHMEAPGKDVGGVLIQVRNDVLSATAGKQVPWEFTALTDAVYLRAAAAPPTPALPGPAAGMPAPPVASLPPDYDKEMEIAFWNAVKDSNSPAMLGTYLDRFPRGTFAGLARLMIEQLKSAPAAAAPGGAPSGVRVANLPTEAATIPPTPGSSPQGLARALQSELKRVGCDPGSLDGTWGAKSRQALERFQRLSKLAFASDEPSEAALQGVASQMGRICPIACEAGETEVNGSCVAKPRAPKHKTVTRPARPNAEPPSTPSFRVCVGGRALGLCTN
jgi:peptidoglycan hydrolase-like protein with peptidoglycan-binding domain